jgi:selenium metabolism protein YedF
MTSSYLIQLKSNSMGSGNDDLGKILMRSFINSLLKQELLPTHILLYNAGVLLAVQETDTATSLSELESKGVQVILCGTCVDFYAIKEQLATGVVGNMVQIATLMAGATKVIAP